MDAKERLEELLNGSPVPSELVLRYLSQNYIISPLTNSLTVIATVKLVDLHLAELAETTSPSEQQRLYKAIGEEARSTMIWDGIISTTEHIRLGRIAVDCYVAIKNWDEVVLVARIGGYPEITQYAAQIAELHQASAYHISLLNIETALLNSDPVEAVRIAIASKNPNLIQYVASTPKSSRKDVEDLLWHAARQGKLPLEEALRLAQRRGEKGMEAVLAEAALAAAENLFEKARIASRYKVGDLGKYILEGAAELSQRTAELREEISDNPADVVRQLDSTSNWALLMNYSTHPAQSQKMEAAIREAYTLLTDAHMLTGDFERAMHTANLCSHPKEQWLQQLVKSAKGIE